MIIEQRYRMERGAAARARQALDVLSAELPPRVLENLRLLVSELVTNSIRHAPRRAGWIAMRVESSPSAVRVEVSDPGLGFDVPQHQPDLTSTSGWGLFLVGELADRWGVEDEPTTRVWFEIDLASDPSSVP